MSRNILFLLFVAISFSAFAQKNDLNHVNLYITYDTIDSLLANENVQAARKVYENTKKRGYYIDAWTHYDFSNKLYYEQGLKRKAKKELLMSARKGILNSAKYSGREEEFLGEVEEKYGKRTVEKVIELNDKLTERIYANHKFVVEEMMALSALDQQLYKDKTYKKYRDYWFSKTYGFTPNDTALDHATAMAGYWEFRHKDSLKTERFVRLIDSLGYIPDERLTGGLVFHVLHVHSAKYTQLSANIDSIYLNSIRSGTMHPHNYAWYKGYYDERHWLPHTYYYTVGRDDIEKLSPEELKAVNERRRKIGLRRCPAVVWDRNIY